MLRPLSKTDLINLAEYLYGTNKGLALAMSELGFDPYLYIKQDVINWLKEIGLVKKNIWEHIQ